MTMTVGQNRLIHTRALLTEFSSADSVPKAVQLRPFVLLT